MSYLYAGTIRNWQGMAQTATGLTVYTDAAGTIEADLTDSVGTPIANPTTADDRGRVDVHSISPTLWYKVTGDSRVMRLLRFCDLVQSTVTGLPFISATDDPFNATGNGSDDDTIAAQAFVDSVAANGGGIAFFPAGTYLVSASLVVPSGVALVGAGRGITTIKLANASNVPVVTISAATDVTIRDLTLDGNRAGQSSAGNLLVATSTTRLAVQDVEVMNAYFQGVALVSCTDAILDRLYVHDIGKDAICLNGVDGCDISHCYVKAWGLYVQGLHSAVSFEQNDCYRVRIVDNEFVNTIDTKFAIEAVPTPLGAAHHSIVQGNLFDGNHLGGSGISMMGEHLSIRDNTLINGVGSGRTGVEVNFATHGVLTGNNIENGQVSFGGSNVVCANNTITIAAFGQMGIQLATANNVLIADNVVEIAHATTTASAIMLGYYAQPAQINHIHVSGNTLRSTLGTGFGIRLLPAASSTAVTITDNVASGFTYGLKYDGADDNLTGLTITHNDFSDDNDYPYTNNCTGVVRAFGNLLIPAALAIPFALVGAGTPEAAVIATPGSFYVDTAGGAGTTLYAKKTGTGNTGWVAI